MPRKSYTLLTAFLIMMLISLWMVVPPISAVSSYVIDGDNGSSVKTVVPASAVSIDLDGVTIYREIRPLIINDRLLVPLRAISEALGCEITWEDDTRTALMAGTTSSGEDFTLILKPDSSQVTGSLSNEIIQVANNELQNAVPVIVEGRTMVPIRFLAAIMAVPVSWDPVSRTVCLNQAVGEDVDKEDESLVRVFSEIDNGLTITMHPGEEIRLELNSNPTTGFTWVINEEPDPSVSVLTGPEFVTDSSSTANIMGAGGKECWQIKAVSPGITTLRLWYMRPWESVQPLHTYCLEIEVL